MQNDDVFRSMRRAMEEATERLFFRELIDVNSKPFNQVFRSGDYQVILKVRDPFKGQIQLFFPKNSAAQLVTEMLGEPVNEIEKIKDGLAEFGNTFGGLFFKDFLRSNGAYQMGLPECRQVENKKAVPLDRVWVFDLDDVNIYAGIQKE